MVRYRKRLIEDRAREANRVAKVLETANIKLASVVTDALGVSAPLVQTWPEKSTLTSSLFVSPFSTSLLMQSLVTYGAGHPESASSLATVCKTSIVKENGPAHLGRPLKSSHNRYGAWESPGKRATPAQVNVLLRRHSCSEALFHCECITALRERRVTSFVTLQRARYGVDL